ncbi:MAG: CapA family protein [Spirochaetes bacterium]|nr:CapA family protein [Spirochaetota bacterium]
MKHIYKLCLIGCGIIILFSGILIEHKFGFISFLNRFFEDPVTSVHIIAAGDAMCHPTQYANAKKSEDNGYDFSGCFQYLPNILAKGDLNIVNLETTLAGPPYSGFPNFCAPDEFAVALKNAGFNFFMLANNHCADTGTEGAMLTVKKLHKMEVLSAGTYLDEQDRQRRYPALVEIKGIKIALLNYTLSTNGLTVKKPVSINMLYNTEQIKKDLETAKNQQADVIIAFLHWGNEFEQTPDMEQKVFAKFFFENGTDIIIGSHPHVAQPAEYFAYDETDIAKKKFVYWSLGNLISDQKKEYTDAGIMASFTITKNKKTNHIQIENHRAIPFWVYRNATLYPGFFVLPAKGFLNDTITLTFKFSNKDYTAFQQSIGNMNKVMPKSDE